MSRVEVDSSIYLVATRWYVAKQHTIELQPSRPTHSRPITGRSLGSIQDLADLAPPLSRAVFNLDFRGVSGARHSPHRRVWGAGVLGAAAPQGMAETKIYYLVGALAFSAACRAWTWTGEPSDLTERPRAGVKGARSAPHGGSAGVTLQQVENQAKTKEKRRRT